MLKIKKCLILVMVVLFCPANLIVNADLFYNVKNFNKLEVDCIFSIGPNCRSCANLSLNNMRFQAGPLDYIGSPINGEFADYSLISAIHLFETHFEDFFIDIEEIPNRFDLKNNKFIKDTRNNIISIHHFNRFNSLAEEQKRFRKKFLRRVRRMENTFKNSDSIGFITNRSNESNEILINFIERFSKLYPDKKIILINIVDVDLDGISQKVVFERDNMKIVNFEFRDSLPPIEEYKNITGWYGSVFAWKSVLNCINLNNYKNMEPLKNDLPL